MGLAELLLGKSNPITQFVNENQNKIRGAFAGFGAEPGFNQSLSNAALGAAQGAPLDQVAAEKRQQEEQARVVRNQTAEWLRSQPGGQQFADALDKGMIDGSTAFKSWIDASKAQQPNLPNEYELFQLSQKDPAFAEYLQAQKSTGSLPTSYQEWQLAQANPEYAKTLASSSTKPPTEGERRNNQLAMVIGPELKTVEENWSALADAGNQVAGTELNGSRPGLAFTSPEYQQAINSLSTIVASYLYSVSGATATDAEIKRQVDLLTPKFGESEQSANAKLDRIRTYAQAVQQAAGRADAQQGGSADPLGIR